MVSSGLCQLSSLGSFKDSGRHRDQLSPNTKLLLHEAWMTPSRGNPFSVLSHGGAAIKGQSSGTRCSRGGFFERPVSQLRRVTKKPRIQVIVGLGGNKWAPCFCMVGSPTGQGVKILDNESPQSISMVSSPSNAGPGCSTGTPLPRPASNSLLISGAILSWP